MQYVGVRRAVPAPVTEQLRVAFKLKQLGRIPDYDHFLAELDHAWMECKRVLSFRAVAFAVSSAIY